jgi:hypothetical protein
MCSLSSFQLITVPRLVYSGRVDRFLYRPKPLFDAIAKHGDTSTGYKLTAILSNFAVWLQACQKTCYQAHVIERCHCADSYYPKYGAAFNYINVSVCSTSNVTQGNPYSYTLIYSSIHAYVRTMGIFQMIASMRSWSSSNQINWFVTVLRLASELWLKCISQNHKSLCLSKVSALTPLKFQLGNGHPMFKR